MLDPVYLPLQSLLAGRYSIDRELGRGGMGVVLLARDVALDRLVAIKVLPVELAHDAEIRERFLREARTAAGLSHPNIVPIHLVEAQGEWVYFVMGYIDGETLRERVARRGPLSSRVAMRVMQEAAWALAYAHERGVVHRDIKPDNIMIEHATERTLVMDFGIATVGTEGATGEVIGTAKYMSPEQAVGEAVDRRTDLYALGATIFFAVTARAPFEAHTMPALLARRLTQPAPKLATVDPRLPARFCEVIDRCLARTPENRFQTGEELASVLDEARGKELRAPPMIRAFVRNAQVSTMVFVAAALAGQGVTLAQGSVSIQGSGFGIIGMILLFQLVIVARRLLREGYTFDDIRLALLSESKVQAEEAEELQQGKFIRQLGGLWYKLWAGRIGRGFFRVAAFHLGRRKPSKVPSADMTEVVLGRSVLEVYDDLSREDRTAAAAVPEVVEALERRAARLRAQDSKGPALMETVAALENVRIALLRLQARSGTVQDVTALLAKVKTMGGRVDRLIEAEAEVDEALRR